MIVPRRALLFLVVSGWLLISLPAFAQVSVSPDHLFLPPGEPSCFTLWIEYPGASIQIYLPGSQQPEYWGPLDAETYLCVEEGWPLGTYTITGILLEQVVPAYAQFRVDAAPAPTITNAGSGCDNWDCMWVLGSRFQPDSRVFVYSADWIHSQIFFGPVLGQLPTFNLAPDGESLSFQMTDPALLSSFGSEGVRVVVENSDGTNSGWRLVRALRPTITSGGPGCDDAYCVWLTGIFPLNARVDFRIAGQSEVVPDAYTDLNVTETALSLRLAPGLRYAYDTAGLNAWVVSPTLANWSDGYHLGPVDRSVIGSIEGIIQSGLQYYVSGWACAKTQPGSIDVHVYAGGPAGGGGTLVFSGTANQASDPGIAQACNSTGTNYRYFLAIPHTVTQYYGGQPLYVHGISPLGYGNHLLTNGGIFQVPGVDRSISGSIEGIIQQGQDYYLHGWACAKTYSGSITVHVFVGGPSGGGGTSAFSGPTDQPSEPAIAAACNSTGSNHRFRLRIPTSVIEQYGGQPFYVHGISPFGLPHSLLNNSGFYVVPSPAPVSPPVSLREYIYIGDRVVAVETSNL